MSALAETPRRELAAGTDVESLAAGWLRAYQASPATQREYERELRRYGDWLAARDLHPLGVRRAVLDEYRNHLADLGLKPSSVRRALAALSSFYTYCEGEDAVAQNPVSRVRRPNTKAPPKLGLSGEELARLLDAAAAEDGRDQGRIPERDHALVCLLALNGMRVSEALSIDIEAIGSQQGVRGVTYTQKGGGQLFAPFNRRTLAAIEKQITHAGVISGPLFQTANGKRLDRQAAYKTIRRLARRAGIDGNVGPHTLRHTFATLTQRSGADTAAVSRAMGHSDPKTTMAYLHGATDLANHPTFLLA